jgi:hypothetical protein
MRAEPRKVHRLELQPEYDFELIALVCNLRDYKMCFELNDTMELALKRAPDIALDDKDRNRSLHVHYAAVDGDNLEFRVVANKGTKGYFVPEKRNIHYFLLIRNANRAFGDSFFSRLRGMPWLEGAYRLDPNELRSAAHFLLLD